MEKWSTTHLGIPQELAQLLDQLSNELIIQRKDIVEIEHW